MSTSTRMLDVYYTLVSGREGVECEEMIEHVLSKQTFTKHGSLDPITFYSKYVIPKITQAKLAKMDIVGLSPNISALVVLLDKKISPEITKILTIGDNTYELHAEDIYCVFALTPDRALNSSVLKYMSLKDNNSINVALKPKKTSRVVKKTDA